MNVRTAESLLCAYRKDKPNEPSIEKALRQVESDEELSRRLAGQVEFDRQLGRALRAIAPSEGLRQRVFGGAARSSGKRPQFAVATTVAAVCGLAIILILVVLFALDRRTRFPGSEAVSKMVMSANSMTGLELEHTASKAGDLGDWFYMRGFESYRMPPGLAAAPAIGSRLFKYDGRTVAQVVVEWHHAIVYIFRADAFGVELPEQDGWHLMQVDDWEAALRKDGNICTLVAFRGEQDEMPAFLQSLEKR